ncbi:hypothetical protein ACQ4PT_065237 [Festuca glaucescens]
MGSPHLHGAQVLGSSAAAAAAPSPSSLADIAAFSRPLLPPNSSLVSSPPPGFLSPHPHPLQQHAHRRMVERERGRTVEAPPPPREPERQQQHHHHTHQQQRHQEPARNGVLAAAGAGATPPQAPALALVTGGAARAAGEHGGAAGPPPPEPLPCRYRECLRNHAARMGAHVLDGCGEFMPTPGDAPAALLCAACGCHRSFHRREPVLVASPTPSPASAVVSPSAAAAPSSRLMPLLLAPPHMHKRPHVVPLTSPMSAPVHASPKSAPAALAESSSEELRPPPPPPPPPPPYPQAAVGVGGSASAPPAPGKKRFRTKFTPEQKERMLDFAHRVGWRVQKPDGGAVDAFCAQVGVPRRVLKVWMHNNKHLAKTPPTTPSQPLPPQPQPHHHPHPAQHNHHQQQQHDP